MSLTDAVALITIGGIIVGIWKEWVSYRDRRSGQRQHLYEIQSGILLEIYTIDTKIHRVTLHLISALKELDALIRDRGDKDAVVQSRKNASVIIEEFAECYAQASQIGMKSIGFLPDAISEIIGELIGGKIFSLSSVQPPNPNTLELMIEQLAQNDKAMMEVRSKLVEKARELMGVDRLSEDNQRLWLSSTSKISINNWWDTIKMLREIRKGF